MSQGQSQGLGGVAYKSTNDLSGTASDVTNGNPIGSTFKNAVGLAVVVDTSNASSVVLASSAVAVKVLGICLNTPKAGDVMQIASARGTSCKVLAGAAVSVGDKIEVDSSGRGITSATAAHKIFGVALEAASGAGVLFECLLLDDVHE